MEKETPVRVIPLLTVSYETGTSPPNVHGLAQPPAVYGIYVISEYLRDMIYPS